MSESSSISPWLTAVAVMCGTFMVVLDTTVVNVSLSHIAGSLSATVEESTWVLTSYIAANAIVLPMTGWLATFFGRERVAIDYWGLALLAIGAGCLQLMLDKGQEEDWFDSRLIITMGLAAVIGIVTFTWRELRAKDPILDLHVFRHRTFTIGIILMT